MWLCSWMWWVDGESLLVGGDSLPMILNFFFSFTCSWRTGDCVKILRGHSHHVTCMAVLSNGLLASGPKYAWCIIWFWDLILCPTLTRDVDTETGPSSTRSLFFFSPWYAIPLYMCMCVFRTRAHTWRPSCGYDFDCCLFMCSHSLLHAITPSFIHSSIHSLEAPKTPPCAYGMASRAFARCR